MSNMVTGTRERGPSAPDRANLSTATAETYKKKAADAQ